MNTLYNNVAELNRNVALNVAFLQLSVCYSLKQSISKEAQIPGES